MIFPTFALVPAANLSRPSALNDSVTIGRFVLTIHSLGLYEILAAHYHLTGFVHKFQHGCLADQATGFIRVLNTRKLNDNALRTRQRLVARLINGSATPNLSTRNLIVSTA